MTDTQNVEILFNTLNRIDSILHKYKYNNLEIPIDISFALEKGDLSMLNTLVKNIKNTSKQPPRKTIRRQHIETCKKDECDMNCIEKGMCLLKKRYLVN